jgi:hypothetical protein
MDSPEIQRSLGRIEGQLETLAEEIRQHFKDDKTNFAAVESDIKKLERKVYYASGFVGALVFLIQNFKAYLFPSG